MKFWAKAGGHKFELDLSEGRILVNGRLAEVSFMEVGSHAFSSIVDGRSASVLIEPQGKAGNYLVSVDGETFEVQILDERDILLERFGMKAAATQTSQRVRAPMPGLVRRILVKNGQFVEAGQGLLVLEAMKMENELRAEIAGEVHSVTATVGAAVGKNELLLEIVNSAA